jgi:hypothetical protein
VALLSDLRNAPPRLNSIASYACYHNTDPSKGLTFFDVGFSFPMLAHRVPVVFGGSLRRHLPRSIGGFRLEDVVHNRRPYKTRKFKLICFLDTLLHI